MATNPYTRVTVSSYNASAPADDGTAVVANQITWAGIKTKLGDPIKTAVDSIDQSVSNAFATSPIQLVSVKLDAGTASVCPLQLQAGTNLTTPVAGGHEYDGKANYSSFAASQRGVAPSKQIVTVQSAAVALSNSSTAVQNIFAAANDALTVAVSTAYRFRALIMLNTGATSHATSFGFGGTATFTSCNYISSALSSAANTLGTPQTRRASVATAIAVAAASTAVTTTFWVDGILRVNAAGTIIPQVTFDAGPTGTCEVALDSFFELWPIGSDTMVSVGPWA